MALVSRKPVPLYVVRLAVNSSPAQAETAWDGGAGKAAQRWEAGLARRATTHLLGFRHTMQKGT